MYFETFCKDLNESPWRGSICEIGVGVPFQSAYLNIPGASKTILFTHSPYNKAFQSTGFRSVSVDATNKLAWEDHLNSHSTFREANLPKDYLFAIAASGAHKSVDEKGQSHGWVTVAYRETEDGGLKASHFHWTAQKEKNLSRENLGENLAYCIAWFLNKVLLNKYETWEQAISDLNSLGINKPEFAVAIDLIEDSNVSIQEHLLLASSTNPLVYHNERFHRAADYIRKYSRCYRGSFNPPTLAHEEIGEGAMFEISLDNARKGRATFADIVHRLKMIDLTGRPTLITAGLPLFVDLHKLLLRHDAKSMEYLVGADTFNAIVDEKYIDTNNPDFFIDFSRVSLAQSAKFLVLPRKDTDLVENKYSKSIDWKNLECSNSHISATDARGGRKEYVSVSVRNYIEDNRLYGWV